MFSLIYTISDSALEFAGVVVQWFDATSLPTLILVAIVLHVAVHRLPSSCRHAGPSVCGGVFLLAYFVHRYLVDGDHFNHLFESVMRSLVASHIIWSITHLVTLSLQWLMGRLDSSASFFRRFALRYFRDIRKAYRGIHQWCLNRSPPPPPIPSVVAPSPSRAVVLRQQAEAAHADYDAEVAALAGLPLDEDEREMLLASAKQRLIRRLSQGEHVDDSRVSTRQQTGSR